MRTWSGIAVTRDGSVVRGRVLTAGGVSIARVDSPEPAPEGAEEALLEAASARTWRGGVESGWRPARDGDEAIDVYEPNWAEVWP